MIFQQGLLSLLDGATSCWFQGSTHIEKDKFISVNSIIIIIIDSSFFILYLYHLLYNIIYNTANHELLLVNNKITTDKTNKYFS